MKTYYLILLFFIFGCTSSQDSNNLELLNHGRLSLKFSQAPATLDNLNIVISAEDIEPIEQMLPAGEIISPIQIDSIPAGDNRSAQLTGYDTNGDLICEGSSANIKILPEQTTTANINMACSYDLLNSFGSLSINVSFSSPPKPADLIINEFLADPPDDIIGDANEDGVRDTNDDEFIEIINITDHEIDLTGATISDSTLVRHIFPETSVIYPLKAIVVFGGGENLNLPYSFQIASSGGLSLNNGGDSIILKSKEDEVLSTINFGAEGGQNQSLTRNPDISGDFTGHLTASGGQFYFSPGKKINGELF